MIAIYLIISSLFLWPLLKAVVWGIIVRKISKNEWNVALSQLLDYLKSNADRNVFLQYLAAMLGISGILPSLLSFTLELSGIDSFVRLGVNIENRSDYISLFLGSLITIGYGAYLYSKNVPKRNDWREMIQSANLVKSQFEFNPNFEWFNRQYERSLKQLGTRYSELINYPIASMPMAVAITARDADKIKKIFEEENNSVTRKVRKIASWGKRSLDEKKVQSVLDEYAKLQALYDNFSIDDIRALAECANQLSKHCHNLHYDEEGNYKSDYAVNELCNAIDGLCQKVEDKWFSFLEKKTLVLTGKAGVGKSHFLGELLTQRKRANLATLLVTGKTFTSTLDPLSQLCSYYDYIGRKELFLKELDEFGKKYNHRVLLIVDGINEGAGADYWMNHLDDFVHQVESYTHLGLIISVRVSSCYNWAYEISQSKEYSVYQYRGFDGDTQSACEYLFRTFGLEFPKWPIMGDEYSNPLFLIKYCRSHQLSGLPLDQEDFWTTIKNYCIEVNKVLSQKHHYNQALNLVFDSLLKIAELMVINGNRWDLEYKNVIDELTNVAKHVDEPNQFLDYLIDEGLLQTDVYKGITYVDFGYERFGDFFISYFLIQKKQYYQWLSNKQCSEYHALSILVPKILGEELYENAPERIKSECFSSFFDTLSYRETLTPHAESFLQELMVKNKEDALLVSLMCLTRNTFPLNASSLYELLYDMTLTERDSFWTVRISQLSGSYIDLALEFAEWGDSVSSSVVSSLSDDVLKLCVEGMAWFLSSTNQQLRDKATHALVNITIGKLSLLEHLIKRFADVNDPYIQERVWAAVYGSVLCSQSSDVAKHVATITYQKVFNVDYVIENILIRDFAKGIIEYAKSLGCAAAIPMEKLQIPFNNVEIPEIPDGAEINRRYKLDFNVTDNKDIYYAQSAILESMVTEHDTRGLIYGDFGRYVFQASLHAFPVDPKVMSWWAITMIFEEYGYDAHLFSHFDSHHQSHDRGFHTIERIGKKYQWIALHRILAILYDAYPDIEVDYDWDNPWTVQRSLDPSIAPQGIQTDTRNDRYSVPDYNIKTIKDDIKWMKSTSKMPPISAYLETIDNSGEKWINLFSYNTISESPKNLDVSKYTRDLWVFVQSFIISNKHLSTVKKAIYKYGLEGRSFHENREIYHLYSREFYWSSNFYADVENTGYYSHIPFSIANIHCDDIITEPTYFIYQQETHDDSSQEDSFHMLMPSKCIYDGLNLMYAKENGAWVDNKTGDLICYDNFVFGHGHSALLVKKSALIKYLKEQNKTVVWPILIERMIKLDHGEGSKYIQCGGYAYLSSEGVIKYKFRDYYPSEFSKWKSKQLRRYKKMMLKVELFLVKHHLMKMSHEESFRYFAEQDEDEIDVIINQDL